MLNIRPFSSQDITQLMIFLKKFNPLISNETWSKLLDYKWQNKEGFKGMILENNNKIVGFLSCIISSGVNNGSEVTYCNLSSWVVDTAFRSQSLQLLSKVFEIKNCIILNLSPHVDTRPIFKALRFEMLAEYEYRINPFKIRYAMFAKSKKPGIEFKELKVPDQNINSSIARMMRDHAPYSNVHFYKVKIKEKESVKELLLAFNEKEIMQNSLKELPYKLIGRTIQSELLYSDSSELLSDYFSEIINEYVSKYKLRVVNVAENFVNKNDLKLSYSVRSSKDCPWFYYSDLEIEAKEISLLYTEKVLLNF
jgi:hypothetical protein